MKKILILAGFAGSVLTFRGQLIEDLLARGLKVIVAAPKIEGTEVGVQLKTMGVEIYNLELTRGGKNFVSDLKYCVSLFRLMCVVRPYYVFAYTIKPAIYGALVSFLTFRPKRYILITGLGYLFGEKTAQSISTKIIYFFLKQAFSSATKVFFQNPDDPFFLQSQSLLSLQKKIVIFNGSGVDLTYFKETALPVKISFLMIARFLVAKGVREYVEAARLIRMNYPEVQFFLVGFIDDNLDAISQDELQTWIHEETIVYLGELKDVRPAIEQSSVYVLPSSYREGTPRSILEAMSMGRPIITTDTPGCRETVISGHNGFLILEKSVEALVKACEAFIQDPDKISLMGHYSRQLAEEKYDVKKVTQQMLNEMEI